MNNLRFRHYDIRLKEMRFSDKHYGEFYVSKNGLMYGYALPKIESDSAVAYYKSCNLEQYTGLKDMSGIYIYEGDIVRFDVKKGDNDGEDYQHNQVGKVVIDPSGVGFGEWCYPHVCNIRIIGNIHQNPELINNN